MKIFSRILLLSIFLLASCNMFQTIGGAESSVGDEFFENSDDDYDYHETLWDDLIAYYNMDDDGNQFNENGSDKILGNSLSPVTGEPGIDGYSVDCNGAGYLISDDDDFNMDDDSFSISMWVMRPNVTVTEDEILIGKGNNSSDGWSLIRESGGEIKFIFLGQTISSGFYLSAEAWTHIVVNVERGSSNKVTFIKNNTFSDELNLSSDSTVNNNYLFSICAFGDGTSIFKGNVDLVGIWNRILTEDEIERLHNDENGLEAPF